jgi:hypothetical protein
VRALGAERGVVAVAGVEPGVVGELVEDPRPHVVDQGRERLRGGGLADAAGEEGVAGEEVGVAGGVVVGDGEGAGGVAAEVDDVEGDLADGEGVALGEQEVGRNRERLGVFGVGGGVGAVGTGDRAECLPVVGMLVGGEDGAQGGPVVGVADEVGQPR